MYNIDKDFETISNNFLKIKELTPVIEKIAQVCVDSVKTGGKIMFCGNGLFFDMGFGEICDCGAVGR